MRCIAVPLYRMIEMSEQLIILDLDGLRDLERGRGPLGRVSGIGEGGNQETDDGKSRGPGRHQTLPVRVAKLAI
jgi:hypothetical protein